MARPIKKPNASRIEREQKEIRRLAESLRIDARNNDSPELRAAIAALDIAVISLAKLKAA